MAVTGSDVDLLALAAIRPGDRKEKLAAAVGARWLEPQPAIAGKVHYLEQDFGFTARLDRDDRVGEVSFKHNFDSTIPIDGLRVGMPEEDIAAALPALKLTELSQAVDRFGVLALDGDAMLNVHVSHGRIMGIRIASESAVYPGKGPPPLPRPTRSFDVAIVPGLRPRGTVAPDGWCCGLPRGITAQQWPLSTATGFPLEHYFTVRVPESYRVKGPQQVALALFGEGEQFEESPDVSALMKIVFDGRPLPTAVDEHVRPFLDHLRNRHPMEFRSRDILCATFVAIWLTEDAFTGAECEPPMPVVNVANRMCPLPHWLQVSAAQRLFGWDGKEAFNPDYLLHKLAKHQPRDKWDILLLAMTERDDDPNTGRQPCDSIAPDSNPDDYVAKYSEAWNRADMEVSYHDLHFGGTASPVQAMPDLSPFYIEFEETMGQINMGGGNGQLDLLTMQIDWACG